MLSDDLRATFLFEQLSDEQIHALEAAGQEILAPLGEIVFHEGEPADYLWVLLDGEIEFSRLVGGQRIVLGTESTPGVYAGGIRAFAGPGSSDGYRASGRALRPTRFFRLPSAALGRLLDEWLPMAKHLLGGYVQMFEAIEMRVRERGRLIALGTLAAGLAHELNNPAAAARSTSGDLRRVLGRLMADVGWFATGELTPAQIGTVLNLQAEAVAQAANATRLSAREAGRREDALATWLEERMIANSWELAPAFVAAGLDEPWLEHAASTLSDTTVSRALNWVAATLAATSLLDQIDEATERISRLVSVVKEYTYMDRSPEQEIDIHADLEKTLLMLGHKLREGISVVREYDEGLPRIVADGSELNQVWTNLLDNAIDAMGGRGDLRIATRHDERAVYVAITDQGPGIAPEIAARIFDPFFTTKEVGKGTGLGLDIVRRIVTERYHGEVTFESEPGATTFLVRLPRPAQP